MNMELESLVMLWLRLLQDLSCRAFWTRHAASFFTLCVPHIAARSQVGKCGAQHLNSSGNNWRQQIQKKKKMS